MEKSRPGRPRVLLVHPHFRVIGGAEKVALAVLRQLLSHWHADVTVLTLERPEEARSQVGWAGECRGSVCFCEAPCPRAVTRWPGKFHLLRLAYLHREAQRIAESFDLCVSTYNELDFGVRGIQYIHHPNFAPRKFMHRYRMISGTGMLDIIPGADRLHRSFLKAVAGVSQERLRNNATAVNSLFMREVVHDLLGIEASVIYPAYLEEPQPGALWEGRTLRFLSVGRFSADKGFLELLDLYRALQTRFPGAEYCLAGRVADRGYYNAVRERAARLGLPLRVAADLDDHRLRELVLSSTCYVGPKKYEHFGIAVLEACAAGCLVFVHDSGGQREIVTPAELRYTDAEDLVRKSGLLLENPRTRQRVLDEVRRGLGRFTDREFQAGIDRLLRPFLSSDEPITGQGEPYR